MMARKQQYYNAEDMYSPVKIHPCLLVFSFRFVSVTFLWRSAPKVRDGFIPPTRSVDGIEP